jgi:hypothetical protein
LRILDLFSGCRSSLNWDGYCNPRAIERGLAEDVAPNIADPGSGLVP